MFIVREKLHIRCCIVIIFHKIQPMVQLSFDVGLQSVHNLFCFLSLNLFTFNFPYWCLFTQVSDVSFFISSYSACCRGT
jgi:hypothetical protein